MEASEWDQLVESSLNRASTQESEPRSAGRSRLKLYPEPRVSFFPMKPRKLSGIDPALRKVIRAVVSGDAPWPLFVGGSTGTGKTCAGLCLIDHSPGWYLTASTLCESVILAMKGQLFTADGRRIGLNAYWESLATSTLVVLDELGSREKITDHHYDCCKRLLDDREGKPMMCISNLNLDQLSALYDDRVASRLSAGTVFYLQGEDRRLPPTPEHP